MGRRGGRPSASRQATPADRATPTAVRRVTGTPLKSLPVTERQTAGVRGGANFSIRRLLTRGVGELVSGVVADAGRPVDQHDARPAVYMRRLALASPDHHSSTRVRSFSKELMDQEGLESIRPCQPANLHCGRCWIRTNLVGFWLGAILRKTPLTRQITTQRYSLLLASFQRVTACRRPRS